MLRSDHDVADQKKYFLSLLKSEESLRDPICDCAC